MTEHQPDVEPVESDEADPPAGRAAEGSFDLAEALHRCDFNTRAGAAGRRAG
ncbi:hypothetical protein ACFVUN_03840 [Kitasatospora griseola]|uniref:hypothetical protein n=1 Tax=Kitasatospora griseola TaxID=2064 RepID=UPI0036D91D7D